MFLGNSTSEVQADDFAGPLLLICLRCSFLHPRCFPLHLRAALFALILPSSLFFVLPLPRTLPFLALFLALAETLTCRRGNVEGLARCHRVL
jgi:hypothetical protein